MDDAPGTAELLGTAVEFEILEAQHLSRQF
jgi:hypothetical protein